MLDSSTNISSTSLKTKRVYLLIYLVGNISISILSSIIFTNLDNLINKYIINKVDLI